MPGGGGGGVRKGRQVVLETIKFYILIFNRLTFYGRQNVHSNLKKKKIEKLSFFCHNWPFFDWASSSAVVLDPGNEVQKQMLNVK